MATILKEDKLYCWGNRDVFNVHTQLQQRGNDYFVWRKLTQVYCPIIGQNIKQAKSKFNQRVNKRLKGKWKETTAREEGGEAVTFDLKVFNAFAPGKPVVYRDGAQVWDRTFRFQEAKNDQIYSIMLLEEPSNRNYYVFFQLAQYQSFGQKPLKAAKQQYEARSRPKPIKWQWSDWESFLKVDPPTIAVCRRSCKARASRSSLKVKRLMVELIFDIKTMEKAVNDMNFDMEKLGNFTKDQVKDGWIALRNIEDAMKQSDRDLKEAWEQFYRKIPHRSRESPSDIVAAKETKEKLKDKIDLLKVLRNILKSKQLMELAREQEALDWAEKLYRQLNCQLTLIAQSSQQFKRVSRYLQQTHAPSHYNYSLELMEVYSCSKEGKPVDYGNRMLLWHGSRMSNWARILANGLKIAPENVPKTGKMFGHGVYFADMSSKSANYCRCRPGKDIGLMLLCDVSLGTPLEKRNAYPEYSAETLPAGYHSVKGLGEIVPNPEQSVTIENGLVVPLGSPTSTKRGGSDLQHNEYVVYNTRQIQFKYLVKVKFHFK